MGTLFRISAYAPTEELAQAGFAAAFDAVDRIERAATDYDPSSEARCLPALCGTGTPHRLSPELAAVVFAADELVEATGGAFNPGVGHLTREWRRALRRGQWPAAAAWESARERSGWSVTLDPISRAIRLEDDSVRFDFGGIAKGVAVDAALQALAAQGIERALVDGGGDVAASGPPPGQGGWRVLARPSIRAAGAAEFERRLLLAHGAVATSGDAYRRAEGLEGEPLPGLGPGQADRRFGHVVDPRTGLPLPGPRAAIVLAPTATRADGLATALMVMGEAGIAEQTLFEHSVFIDPQGRPCMGAAFPQDDGALVTWTGPPGDPSPTPRR